MTSDYIGGRNAVLESLRNKRLAVGALLVAESASGSRIDEAKVLASDREIPIRTSTTEELNELAGQTAHQGLVISVEELHPHALEDLLEQSKTVTNRRLFVLDQVQDPVNLGKLARSALYFGFQGIIKTKDRSAPLSGTVIQASAGAAARLPIAQVKNLRRALETLKDERFWLVGTVPEAEKTLEEVPTDRDLAILVGHEGSGLRRLTREECDYLVRIPGSGDFESLNVATAGAVSAYALRRPASSVKNED